MRHIPDHLIQQVREATDIVDLVGGYATLKKAGKGYKACCPFHTEKTPSFNVSPERGSWKCFGCGKGGDAFGFVMEKEGLEFPDAIRRLAERAGIELEAEDPAAARQNRRLVELREINEWACLLFQAALRHRRGARAREYLARRGITPETTERFRLGYALDSWEALLRLGQQKGYSPEDLDDAGLVIARPEGHRRGPGRYDRFRDRLMFPIADTRGRVIAFGARALGDQEPKYLNSSESPLFTKGKHLYAVHLAKDAMLRTDEGAVMEGYTDVIMTHQAGWPVAVAGLGTALTGDQARLLGRYAKRVFLVYDGDKPGLRAAERAISQFLPEDVETRVAVLPPGEDPCDVISKRGLPAFREHIDAAKDAFEHLLHTRMAEHDVSTVPGREHALDDVLEALGDVDNQLRRTLYARQAAQALEIPDDLVAERLDGVRKQAAERRRRAASRQSAAEATSAASASGPSGARPGAGPGSPRAARGTEPGDGVPWDAYGNVAPPEDGGEVEIDLGPHAAPTTGPRPLKVPPSRPVAAVRLPPLEEQLLQAALGDPEFLAELGRTSDPDDLSHPVGRALLGELLLAHEEDGCVPEDLGERIEDTSVRTLLEALRAPVPGRARLARGSTADLSAQGMSALRHLRYSARVRAIEAGKRAAEERGDQAEFDALWRQEIELRKEGPS